jgi:hypothetical protein
MSIYIQKLLFWWMAIGNYWIYWVFQWLLLSYFRGTLVQKKCFCDENRTVDWCQIDFGLLQTPVAFAQRFWHHANRELLQE